MPSSVLLAKVARRWFYNHDTLRNRSLAYILRNFLCDREIPTWTKEGFIINASPRDHVSHSIFLFGNYDPTMTSFFKAYVREGMECWDIGSERGWFTLLFGRLVGSQGKVNAFEAFPRNFKKLVENISLNKYHWVQAYNYAIYSSKGEMFFVPPSSLNQNNGVGYLSSKRCPGAERIETISLDEHATSTGTKRLDFVKMDIEGAELSALQGFEKSIKEFRPILAIEYNRETTLRAGASIEELDKQLDKLGYDRFTFDGRLNKLNLQNYEKIKESEVVFNVYCFPRK